MDSGQVSIEIYYWILRLECFGCAAVMFNNQGLNMLLNMFFGTIINAARGIGNVLNGMVMQLVTNF